MTSFDYIIIGAGSAGCVLANRLSEDADVSVLLIEAGGPPKSLLVRMPMAYRILRSSGKFSWRYRTEPEPFLDGRLIEIPRGKALGGSSSINGMLYIRGHPRDYDLWRQSGCEGWSYADALPYFKRAESNWRGGTEFHGADGPLGVTPIDTTHLRYERVKQTVENAGIPLTDDFHGTQPEGLGIVDLTVKNGERASTAKTYLAAAMGRPNLSVETHALTHRIVIENGRAVGVEYGRDGRKVIARAEREVVLSAGSYNSPQILMLSGVGPADELAKHGIDVVHEMPTVGKNLSEHAVVPVHYKLKNSDTFLEQLRFDRVAIEAVKWGLFRKGYMSTQALTAMMFVKTQPELERPDIQMFFNSVRMDAKIWFPIVKPAMGHMLESYICILHPESRGSVTLASADPAAAPRISFRMMEREEDRATLRRGIMLSREIYATAPMGDLVECETLPGADVVSDEGLNAHLRKHVGIVHHPVGTCAMGHGPAAVVDPQLRVHGLDGLRVVDASIMPTLPGGNTNAPTIMVAERASDLIRGRKPPAPAEHASWNG